MPEEFLDIVDDSDRIIGRDTRKRVHDGYHIHRGIHVFVVNQAGEILVQKRSMEKDYYPGALDISVGAQVASGESYEEAAVRELSEEIGCKHGPIEFLADYDAFSERQREKRRIFVHHCEGPFSIDPAEVAEVRFLSIAELSASLDPKSSTEGFRRSLEIYRHLRQ